MPDYVYRVTLTQSLWGETLQNVLHFTHFEANPLAMPELVTDLKATWIPQVKWIQQDQLRYVGARVQILESQYAAYSEALNVAGSAGGSNDYKTYNAHILQLRTPFLGRTGRGRQYIGGVALNLTDKGIIKSDIVTSWNNHILTLVDTYCQSGVSNFRLVVNPHGPTVNAKIVTSITLNPIEGIQRRRNIGVGI